MPLIGIGFLAYEAYQAYQAWTQQAQSGGLASGWSVFRDCNKAGGAYWRAVGYNCGQVQATDASLAANFHTSSGAALAANPSSLLLTSFQYNGKPGSYHLLDPDIVYQRSSTAVPAPPYTEAFVRPVPVGAPGSLVVPNVWPIATPVAPRPNRKPKRRPPPPPRPPWEEPSNPTRPRPHPRRRRREEPRRPIYEFPPVPEAPVVVVNPVPFPVIPTPTVITSPSPDAPIVVERPPANPSPDRPPPRRTVQRKVNIAIVGGLVWTGINFTTEAFDFILAMHDALPSHLRLSSRASKRQKILHMTKNFELWTHIDVAEAIENYINMQIGDYVAALGSNQNRSLARLTGNLTGVDRAMSQHEKNIFEATGRSRADFTPTLDIDMESGRVTLQWAGYDIAVYD